VKVFPVNRFEAVGCILVVILWLISAPLFAQTPDEPEQAPLEEGTQEEPATEPATEPADETEVEPEIEAVDIEDPVLREAMEADSAWRAWMEPDSVGARSYWFRYSFETDAQPSAGSIWLTADDDFSLYINGVYIASDDQDTTDWMEVKEYDVGEYLQYGKNVIAVETSDIDATRHGLKVGLIYETIPDIEQQLELMVDRELETQEKRRLEQERMAATEAEEAREGALTPEELWEMRTIEKNRLR